MVAFSNPIARDSSKFMRYGEWVFSIFALVFIIGPTRTLLVGLEIRGYTISSAVEGNTKVQVVMVAIYITTLFLIYLRWQIVKKLIFNNIILLAFLLFLAASPLWADLTGLSARRTIALLGNTLLAYYLVSRFSPREFLTLLGWVFAIVLLLNAAAIVAIPSIGIGPYGGGAFRGLHGQKNDFGQVMVLAAIVFWVLRKRPGWQGASAWCAFLLALFLAVMSRSGSAWSVLFGLFFVSVPLLYVLRNPTFSPALRLVWVAIVGIGGFVFLLVHLYGFGLELIGKDITLTDRTRIWDLVIDQGWKQPWLGHGYGSFWEGNTGRLFAMVWSEIGHAHNGYIDIWLSLGFVGLGLFIALLVVTGARAVNDLLRTGDEIAVFIVMFMLYVLPYMVVAKMIPDHRTVPWLVLVCVALYARLRSGLWRRSMLPDSSLGRGRVPAAAE